MRRLAFAVAALAGTAALCAFRFDPATVRPRVFTPNGDGRNDRVFFIYENPTNLPVRVTIFDASGGWVRDVATPGPVAALSKIWDGRDDAGRPAPAGVYFFRLEADARIFVGSLVLAR